MGRTGVDVVRSGKVAATKTIDAPLILDTAAELLECAGVDGFSMRGLADRLGVAVTSIYWHVGGRDKLFDRLIDRLIDEMTSLPADGDTPAECIAALARAQRQVLINRQHLLIVAHERDRTPALFQPVQQTLADKLAESGVTGVNAALALRSIEVHVISSALMQYSSIRSGEHDEEDASLWGGDWPDRELIDALRSPTDYDAVFEYGLAALLASLGSTS
ncbi:MAG: TetR/AcrR family transcriptional regulator [Mycobacterium sp.]